MLESNLIGLFSRQ